MRSEEVIQSIIRRVDNSEHHGKVPYCSTVLPWVPY